MKKLVTITYLFLCIACTHKRNKEDASRKDDSLQLQIAEKAKNDSEQYRIFQLENRLKMEGMEEPYIPTYKREIFRFIYWIKYGNEFYIRIEQQPDSTFVMISKFYLPHSGNYVFTNTTIPFKQAIIDYPEKPAADTFIYFSVTQPLSREDWITFKRIINGSYYWAFENPYEGCHPYDPEFLSLESKSLLPNYLSSDTLFYHNNRVTIPLKGSYTDAFEFLEKKSLLLQKLGIKSFHKWFRWNSKHSR